MKRYQGTMVTLKRNNAHTLRLVIVLAAISTSAVKVRPIRVCTPFMRFIDHETYAKNAPYARYRNVEMDEVPFVLDRL
jgi:hypothetical protein